MNFIFNIQDTKKINDRRKLKEEIKTRIKTKN